MNFEKPKPPVGGAIKKKPKKEYVIIHPKKPMTTDEILEEMDKQGLRPATHEEAQDFMLRKFVLPNDEGRIEPSEDDIITEGVDVTNEGKRLPPKKE